MAYFRKLTCAECEVSTPYFQLTTDEFYYMKIDLKDKVEKDGNEYYKEYCICPKCEQPEETLFAKVRATLQHLVSI